MGGVDGDGCNDRKNMFEEAVVEPLVFFFSRSFSTHNLGDADPRLVRFSPATSAGPCPAISSGDFRIFSSCSSGFRPSG